MKTEPEIRRIDIVLLGDFNPKIFSPAWIAAQNLIGSSDADTASVEVIHPDIAIFSLSWCKFIIQRERLTAFTEQEPYFIHLFDLISGIFSELLHTPIHSLGLNWGFHFQCESEDEWHSFGHFLAPQFPWNGILEDSGMMLLEVTNKKLPDNPLDGKIGIRVQPSKPIKHGLFFNINHHFELSDKTKVIGCHQIIDTLKEKWQGSKSMAEKVPFKLYENLLKGSK